MTDAQRHEFFQYYRKKNGKARLTPADVRDIRAKSDAGMTYATIAGFYPTVAYETIARVARRQTHKDVPEFDLAPSEEVSQEDAEAMVARLHEETKRLWEGSADRLVEELGGAPSEQFPRRDEHGKSAAPPSPLDEEGETK